MKLSDITETVVPFETAEAKKKRLKHEQQVNDLKNIDHKANQHKLNVMANRSKIKSVK